MTISKDNAKRIARQLCAKHKEAADKVTNEFEKIVLAAYLKTIPKEVLSLSKKHPEYFRTCSTINVSGNGLTYQNVDTPNDETIINNSGNYYAVFTPSKDSAEKMVKEKRESEKAQDHYKKLLNETTQALITLKTTARIIKEFPEAATFFPNPVYPVPVVVNLEKLRAEFKTTKKES